ncbi:hypothetical protein MYX77_02000 [Acidobacteriia bacterium AH_259_A11_L15]|nr:hypothetical protein [Acidobacteriia bacterium AH_259_A11_L15]
MGRKVLAFIASAVYGYDLVASLYAEDLLSEVYVQQKLPLSNRLWHYVKDLSMGEWIDIAINERSRKLLINAEIKMPKVKAVYFTKFKELRSTVVADGAVIVVYGTRIVPSRLYKGSFQTINIHWGLSPYYRGVRTTEGAILNSDLRNIGFTLHELSNTVDGGPVITQGRVKTKVGDTVGSINTRIHNQAKEKLLKVVMIATHQKLSSVPQDLSLGKNYKLRDWPIQDAIKLHRLTPIRKLTLEQSRGELRIFENPMI